MTVNESTRSRRTASTLWHAVHDLSSLVSPFLVSIRTILQDRIVLWRFRCQNPRSIDHYERVLLAMIACNWNQWRRQEDCEE
ncbi:hypothetical protein Syun_016286 [Stephania yunnanensis]|uniref:Uncharacterized protein n=1 Tax=Stephania yunnanensis TaxID=152371 RepID=A0AAP0J4W4_9MAGN